MRTRAPPAEQTRCWTVPAGKVTDQATLAAAAKARVHWLTSETIEPCWGAVATVPSLKPPGLLFCCAFLLPLPLPPAVRPPLVTGRCAPARTLPHLLHARRQGHHHRDPVQQSRQQEAGVHGRVLPVVHVRHREAAALRARPADQRPARSSARAAVSSVPRHNVSGARDGQGIPYAQALAGRGARWAAAAACAFRRPASEMYVYQSAYQR